MLVLPLGLYRLPTESISLKQTMGGIYPLGDHADPLNSLPSIQRARTSGSFHGAFHRASQSALAHEQAASLMHKMKRSKCLFLSKQLQEPNWKKDK